MDKNLVQYYKLTHLQGMSVGDTLIFPLEQMRTIRTQASMYGAIWNRVFKTRMDRENRTLIVERTQ
jgi:hypothetical protein